MKKKQPSTRNTNTYSKEQAKHLKRIRSFIKSAEERGYKFYDKKVPPSLKMKAGFNEFQIPKTVKNPTPVTVARLEKITKEYLYERALWIDPESGTVHSAKKGRQIERSRAAKKGAETRKRKNNPPPPDVNLNLAILDTIREHIEELQTLTAGKPELTEYKNRIGSYMLDMFDDIISSVDMNGDLYAYSAYLESRANEIHNILDDAKVASDRSQVDVNITAFMSIINRGPLTQEQIDNLTDYTEAMGYGGGQF